ncbi:VOC family protein [Streptomyces zhihengii]
MACRITEIVIDAQDPNRLAAFWCEVLGYVELDREADGSIQIGPPGAEAAARCRPSSSAPAATRAPKLPVHFDLNATDRDQEAELARLLALGAVPADVGQSGEESWHVLADPEGNEFCLLRARVKPV